MRLAAGSDETGSDDTGSDGAASGTVITGSMLVLLVLVLVLFVLVSLVALSCIRLFSLVEAVSLLTNITSISSSGLATSSAIAGGFCGLAAIVTNGCTLRLRLIVRMSWPLTTEMVRLYIPGALSIGSCIRVFVSAKNTCCRLNTSLLPSSMATLSLKPCSCSADNSSPLSLASCTSI